MSKVKMMESEEDDKLRGNEYHLCQLTCARTPKEAEKIRKNKRKRPDITRTNRKQTQWQPLQLQANNKRVASNRPSTSKAHQAISSVQTYIKKKNQSLPNKRLFGKDETFQPVVILWSTRNWLDVPHLCQI
ncbi:hypothetical protein RUM44_000449 [Polyplax serrata]|uniref:Uncharacterized protein n=1 Tax=Polyplax serrata TaxID=468196 RepID=A0ABR1B5G1_POLSC